MPTGNVKSGCTCVASPCPRTPKRQSVFQIGRPKRQYCVALGAGYLAISGDISRSFMHIFVPFAMASFVELENV